MAVSDGERHVFGLHDQIAHGDHQPVRADHRPVADAFGAERLRRRTARQAHLHDAGPHRFWTRA